MYVCEDCGCEFYEPHIYEERHGLPSPPYEQFAVCPRCYSTNFDERREEEDEE